MRRQPTGDEEKPANTKDSLGMRFNIYGSQSKATTRGYCRETGSLNLDPGFRRKVSVAINSQPHHAHCGRLA